MVSYANAEMMALEDAFPDYLSGHGIFDALSGYDWIPDSSTALALNTEYYLGRSGRKLASPLVSRMVGTVSGTLDNSAVTLLGKIISTRFRPKWDKIWDDLSSTLSVFANVDYKETVKYGHKVDTDASNARTKSGTETHTLDGEQNVEESFPDNNGRVQTRTITGGWKDTDTTSRTRTGTETATESFPDANGRVVEKVTTGGWSDTDATANVRTGVQKVTDKGDTLDSVYGFNSSNAVPSARTGPADSSVGITQETDYGVNGIRDQKSGAITRAYTGTGLNEKSTETGSKRLETSYGVNGVKDENAGDMTRLYQNYSDTLSETGRKLTVTSYGDSGKTDTLSFSNRSDGETIDETVTHSGTDETTVKGVNIKRLTDKLDILKEMYENPRLFDFMEIVYSDIDSVLTCPIFV